MAGFRFHYPPPPPTTANPSSKPTQNWLFARVSRGSRPHTGPQHGGTRHIKPACTPDAALTPACTCRPLCQLCGCAGVKDPCGLDRRPAHVWCWWGGAHIRLFCGEWALTECSALSAALQRLHASACCATMRCGWDPSRPAGEQEAGLDAGWTGRVCTWGCTVHAAPPTAPQPSPKTATMQARLHLCPHRSQCTTSNWAQQLRLRLPACPGPPPCPSSSS